MLTLRRLLTNHLRHHGASSAGISQSTSGCPIARAIRHGTRANQVQIEYDPCRGEDAVSLVIDGRPHPLPEWAEIFVREVDDLGVDGRIAGVTGEACLLILEGRSS